MAKTLLVSVLFVAAFTAACSLPPPKDFLGYVNHHGFQGRAIQQYQISESQIVSPNVQLSWESDGVLRGWLDGSTAELRVAGSTIKGFRGGGVIDLYVTREGNAVVARGMYAGGIADMAVCARPSDPTAAPGEVKPFAGERPCLADNAVTIGKMFEKLGDTRAMAMIMAVYYH